MEEYDWSTFWNEVETGAPQRRRTQSLPPAKSRITSRNTVPLGGSEGGAEQPVGGQEEVTPTESTVVKGESDKETQDTLRKAYESLNTVAKTGVTPGAQVQTTIAQTPPKTSEPSTTSKFIPWYKGGGGTPPPPTPGESPSGVTDDGFGEPFYETGVRGYYDTWKGRIRI
jgi:hypothetical protein